VINIKTVMRVFDRGNGKPARDQTGQQPLDQRRLTRAAPPCQPDDPHLTLPLSLTTPALTGSPQFVKSGRMTVTTLDLKGLKCPLPALRTRKALTRLKSGERLHVLATDPMTAIDIPHALQGTGDRLIEQTRNDESLSFLIEKS
jgi:tRNA 2-thiouridine synthesizing protein A